MTSIYFFVVKRVKERQINATLLNIRMYTFMKYHMKRRPVKYKFLKRIYIFSMVALGLIRYMFPRHNISQKAGKNTSNSEK